MNSTIKNINDFTNNLSVREYAQTMIANKGKLLKAVFTKKDGSERTMLFTVATNWNPLNGITTTKSGRRMIETKCSRNMATVTERLADGSFAPRTLNLSTIISLDIVR